MTDKPEIPGFIHNAQSPDVFADNAVGFFNLNGVIRITFESARVNHITSPGPVDRVVVGRLVMPVDAAEGMAQSLLAFIEQQRELASGAESQSNVTIQ
jgi:hypothetical protein